MAPKKSKCQGKQKNNLKIKSKPNPRPRLIAKTMKKSKSAEKPLDNFKWLNSGPVDSTVNHSQTMPKWLTSSVYKHGRTREPSAENSSTYTDVPAEEVDDKSSATSQTSDECNCNHGKYFSGSKGGILKNKMSSTNSDVAKYIKSGMDHVAAFIVESAIRFGEEHGVVVPDKNTPNVYELMPPHKSTYTDKCRKIRFKVPEKESSSSEYEESKKGSWRSSSKGQVPCLPKKGDLKYLCDVPSSTWSSQMDSLEDILPLLEKLKNDGGLIESELDIDKLARESSSSHNDRKRERERDRDRDRDRPRDKYRLKMDKRYKSLDDLSKSSEDQEDYDSDDKPVWKRFKRDSLELGRQRLRAATCPRQPERESPSLSPSPF